jgi:hypothetical protein
VWNIFLVIRYPELENRLCRVGSCEVIALHTCLELVRLQVNKKTLLVSAATGAAVKDVSGFVLGFEYSLDLSKCLAMAKVIESVENRVTFDASVRSTDTVFTC